MSKENGKEKKDLRDYGIIYVSGSIDEGASRTVCQEIIEMNVSGESGHIQMIINSGGGSCPAGFSIIDIMEWSRIPIYTTGIGIVASMALMILMTGQKGRRVITPRTSILSHRYSALLMGSHSQLLAGRREQDLMHKRIVEHYLTYSNVNNRENIESALLRDVDTWLTPEEAVQYGLADVVEPVRRLDSNPQGG